MVKHYLKLIKFTVIIMFFKIYTSFTHVFVGFAMKMHKHLKIAVKTYNVGVKT